MKIQWNELYEGGRDYGVMNQLLLDLALAEAKTPKGGRALDIGCGTGDLSVKLATRGFSVTGIDLAPVAIEKARQRSEDAGTGTRTEFSVLDIEDPGQREQLEDQKFDLITCRLVYAFIQDKPAFLAWVKGHLSEQGSFVLIAPVLHEGVHYSDRLNTISVLLATLSQQLTAVFDSVHDIHTNYFEDQGDLRTIVAR